MWTEDAGRYQIVMEGARERGRGEGGRGYWERGKDTGRKERLQG